MNAKEFLAAIKQGQKVFRDLILRDENFANTNFSELDLQGCTFIRCNFEQCNFDKTDLTKSFLSYSNFTIASLRKTVFDNSVMHRVSLDGAECRGASFKGVVISARHIGRPSHAVIDNITAQFTRNNNKTKPAYDFEQD